MEIKTLAGEKRTHENKDLHRIATVFTTSGLNYEIPKKFSCPKLGDSHRSAESLEIYKINFHLQRDFFVHQCSQHAIKSPHHEFRNPVC